MTKFKCILALLLFSAFIVKSQAQTDITADFTDTNFRAEVYKEISKTAPVPILDTDVAGIVWLNVSKKNIASLNGIQHCTALQTLYCTDNQLTVLDVSGLNRLQYLYCSKNYLEAPPTGYNPGMTTSYEFHPQTTEE